MDNRKPEHHTYIIDDPNEPEEVARLLQQILLEKLRSVSVWSVAKK